MKIGTAVNHIFIALVWITKRMNRRDLVTSPSRRLIYDPTKINWIKDDDGSFRLQNK